MRVVVPGKGILELLAQRRVKPLEGEAGRYVFGFAAARWDDARRKHRSERRHAFERAVRMPKLIRFVAQGKPVIGRHDLAVLADRAEDNKMGARALRADLGHFGRTEAAREGELGLVGHLLAAKDQNRMFLESRSRRRVSGIMHRALRKRHTTRLDGEAR